MPKSKFTLLINLNKLLVVFPPAFVADTKMRNGYNFIVPLSVHDKRI